MEGKMILSLEEIRMLAKVERDMDSGKQPWVMTSGGRMSVNPQIMRHFDLRTGQTASHALVLEILNAHIALCTRMIDEQQAKAEPPTDTCRCCGSGDCDGYCDCP